MKTQFLEYVTRKQREAKNHLKLIEKLLQKGDLQASSYLEDEEPYIFVKSPIKNMSFDGIRIYEIGDMIAYRIQKESKTEPFGKSYLIDIEDMFNDFMGENMKEEEAGKKVVESVIVELKKFFEKSSKAEEELKNTDYDQNLIVKAGYSDYASQVLNKF